MEPPENPELVTMEWDARGATSVLVTPEWLRVREPTALIQQILSRSVAHFDRPPASGWRKGLRLRDVPLNQLREFTLLLREARAEQEAQAPDDVQQISSRHAVSRWADGALVGLTADEDWLLGASVQTISDEFVAVLVQPPADTRRPSPSRDRIERFMKEYSR